MLETQNGLLAVVHDHLMTRFKGIGIGAERLA